MAPLRQLDRQTYDLPMPAPKTGKGPWGEAVNYWLPRCNMRAADLARASGIDPKTISSIQRGFHTQTSMLQKIADAFDATARANKLGFRVIINDVLISPARRHADENLDRLIREAVASAIRIDREQRATPSITEAFDAHIAEIERKEDRKDSIPARIKPRRKSTKR